ncbi:MAG TPA: hypothetical protein VHZ75_02655 [Solirubrobacteraceae bacterium]|nr:hypothetical protein [Solirubrobacteraceae bacterium]
MASNVSFALANGSTSLAFDAGHPKQTVVLTALAPVTVTGAGTLVGPGGSGAPTTSAFTKGADGCAPVAPDTTRPLAAGETCTIDVSYTPGASPVGGALNLNTSAGTKGVLLRGDAPKSTVCAPGCGSSGTLTAFSAVAGTSSAVQTFRIKNGTGDTSRAPLGNIAVAAPPGFVVDTSACTTPVAISSDCTVSVTFAPTAAGTFAGTMVISSNDPIPGPTIAVTGIATAASMSVPPPAPTPITPTSPPIAPNPVAPVGPRAPITVKAPSAQAATASRIAVSAFGLHPSTIVSGARASFRYTLSAKARVSVVVARRLAGRKARYRRRGALTGSGKGGANTLTFKGRFGSTPLPAGRYRASITATTSSGRHSVTRTVTFTVHAAKHG